MIPSDTSIAARQKQIELLSKMAPGQRVDLALQLSADVINMSRRAIKRINPGWTKDDIDYRFIELHYGKQLADEVRDYKLSKSR